MKKYLAIFAVLFTVILSSCSNDDIPVTYSTTFKVNPATVVNNLFEAKAGDLTSLNSGTTLNVTLYIYDQSGVLIESASEEFSAYTHMMNKDIALAPGSYTAVATTNVSSSVEYWSFSGQEQLSTFKITDEGYIGGKSKILGLTIKKFEVGNSSTTIPVDVENAGAVSYVQFYHWNKYNNVSTYSLNGKQSCDYMSFDNLGNADYSIETSTSYRWYCAKFEYDSKYTGANTYFFTFPIRNASFAFFAETTSGEDVQMSSNLVDDVIKGDSYWFLYDFDEDEAYWYDMTPSRASDEDNKAKYLNSDNEAIIYDGNTIRIKS